MYYSCACEYVSALMLLEMDVVDTGLSMKVTDSGLSALASAGCGAQLTFLTLQCL